MEKEKELKQGIKMLECFVCGGLGFLGEAPCSSCGSNRLFETLVTEEEYNFHLDIHKQFDETGEIK